MSRFKPFSIGPFGGLNQDENPHAVGDNELIETMNVVSSGKRLGTRPGTVQEAAGKQYEKTLTGAKAVVGMHEHRENVDANRRLLVISDDGGTQNIFYNDASLLPNGAQITPGQDNFWMMVSHNNLTFGAGGAETDDFWSWDGVPANAAAAIPAVDSLGARLRPQHVFAWRNHVFINGLRGGVISDNNPSSTRFGTLATDLTLAASWPSGNTIGFNAFGKSHTTGFGAYQDNKGDFLIILTNTGLASVVLTGGFPFFAVNDSIANGCVGQKAFANLGLDSGDAVYMSDRGFHSLRQSQIHGARADTFLSWKIRPFMETLRESRKKFTVSAYDHVRGLLVFAVTTDSSSAHNRLLVLDVKDQDSITADNARWYIWRISGVAINDLKMARDEDGVWRLYFGTTTGEVGFFSDDTFSDLGSAYSAKFQTKHNDYGSTMSTKTAGDTMITLHPGGSYQPSLRYVFDYGAKTSTERLLSMASVSGGSQWGTAQWGTSKWAASSAVRDEKAYGSGSGRTIGLIVEHTGGNEPFFVSKIVQHVKVSGENTGDTANAA